MIDHLTISHGRIVEPRHLHLVPSWPDESDVDTHYDVQQSNPVATAVVLAALSLFLGGLAWVVFL